MVSENGARVGLAYSARTPRFVDEHPGQIDYVEIPFELLRHNPGVLDIRSALPVVMHCASLSIAGTVRPQPQVLEAVADWADKTATPWIGEHLSFILAEREMGDPAADEYAPGEPWNIGYTVSPQMTHQTLERIVAALAHAESVLPVPLLLENPPIYFDVPGSTMSQIEFINELCAATDIGLLLDLAHFYISARNRGEDPADALIRFPLDRVVEVHVSGVDEQAGGIWDNHASRAPQAELDLLATVVREAPVQAITLEYNWSARFPDQVLLAELSRVRDVLSTAVPA
ncbi:MAG TPA: DUF692 family protein [Jatrophihabitans sp.]|nr:DUF692 family protein [Jatrophihabitans sp.]